MIRQLLLLTLSALVVHGVQANCTLAPESPQPHIFNIPAKTIIIDVRAPADTSSAIDTEYTSPQGSDIKYDNCVQGEAYGKSSLNIGTQDASTQIFPTSIDGIGVRITWNNGTSFGTGVLPDPRTMDFTPDPQGSWVYPGSSYFRVQFFKTKSKLSLSDPEGQEVLPAEEIAYNWVTADSPANFGQQLDIGQIKLISTPSCSYEYSKVIDFNEVSSRSLSTTIERDLSFSLTCSTDYGFYSATASITADDRSADGAFIKVKDAAGKSDLMGIKIRNDDGADIKVDGTSVEEVANVASDAPAEFNWKAVLFPTGTVHPTNGDFTAHAEILLQLK
ncbi:fimbrial protein [Buttiauxella agrestis]|uniref:fimbrial protein n=1 Tax=Buttiauxella agrestis TaxID=82977 RepID=UPI003976B52F